MLALEFCPVCDSHSIRPLFVWHDRSRNCAWNVSECEHCTVAFTNPQPSWQELQPYYTKDYWPYQPASANELAQLLEEALRTGEYDRVTIGSKDRVLEIGPGGGRFLYVAKSICSKAVGVEPSEAAAKILRAQGLNIFHGHVDEFANSYDGESFSLVLLSHVLEHLPKPLETLKNIRKVISEQSNVVLRMPNAGSWAFRVVKGDWMGTDLPRHLIHWNETALEILAQRAGMRIVKTNFESPPGIVGQALTARARFGFNLSDKIVWLAPMLVDRLAAHLARRWVTSTTAMNIEVHLRVAT